MAKDVDEIVVGADGTIWVAPVGTAAPADESAAPGAGWTDLGYASEDGATFRDGKTLEVIPVWQLFHPARRIVTARDTNVAFTLRQWNPDTVSLAFGGGVVTEVTAGHYKLTPPAAGDLDERSLLLDWHDGAKDYRLVIVRGMVTENVETKLVRNAAGDLPITFAVNGSDVGDPWYLLSNDPALNPA